jgi:Ca-activated chloride channel family protein
MDVSGSIHAREYEIQRNATADALISPEIVSLSERRGGIAVSTIMFSEDAQIMTPWRVIQSGQDAIRVANEIRGIQRPMMGGTMTGRGISVALNHLQNAPCQEEMVIDVSTDGPSDDQGQLNQARDDAIQAGVQINGLAIHTPSEYMSEEQIQKHAANIRSWMRNMLVTPDGFVVDAQSWEQYPEAIRRKLVREIAGLNKFIR